MKTFTKEAAPKSVNWPTNLVSVSVSIPRQKAMVKWQNLGIFANGVKPPQAKVICRVKAGREVVA